MHLQPLFTLMIIQGGKDYQSQNPNSQAECYKWAEYYKWLTDLHKVFWWGLQLSKTFPSCPMHEQKCYSTAWFPPQRVSNAWPLQTRHILVEHKHKTCYFIKHTAIDSRVVLVWTASLERWVICIICFTCAYLFLRIIGRTTRTCTISVYYTLY